MNFTPEQIELVVQRVLEHLGTPADRAPAATGLANAPPPAAVPKGVRISEPVVTQALLAEMVNGSKQVRVSPTTILTPSARDFIRNQGIEILREPSSPKASSFVRWQVIATVSTPQIAAAVEGLTAQGVAVDFRQLGLPAEAASQAISALCRGEAAKVVVFTSASELVACLANRNDRLRAAAVADVAAVERVRKTLNANVLAIDPSSKGVHELKAYFKAFSQ
jgi:hypothetical protein